MSEEKKTGCGQGQSVRMCLFSTAQEAGFRFEMHVADFEETFFEHLSAAGPGCLGPLLTNLL